MKKPKLFIATLVIIMIFLSVVQVVVSNSLSTTGQMLGKLDKEIQSYKKENTLLKEKLLSVSSLTNVASEAAHLGFVENKSNVFLTAPLPLAVKQ